ncbi:MAG: cyclic peptide export ABC transporter [Ginsengibacter sp.]
MGQQIFFNKSIKLYFLVIVFGITNCLLNTGLIYYLNRIIQKKEFLFPTLYFILFILILVASFGMNKFFQQFIIRMANEQLFQFESNVLKTVKKSPLQLFEKLGSEKIFTAIEDARAFSLLPSVFTNTLNALISIFICLTYLFVIYWQGALILLIMIVAFILLYLKRSKSLKRQRRQLRKLNDQYFRFINDLIHGFKQLKTNALRSHNFSIHFLQKNRDEALLLENKTSIGFLDNVLIGRYSWYIIIGFLVFLFPYFSSVTSSQLIAFLFVLIFLMAPINLIMSLESYYLGVIVAWDRLKAFEQELTQKFKEEEPESVAREKSDSFQQIVFEDVQFVYANSSNVPNFFLGPLNLTINKGEVLFITGGNGSGKSTFLLLLTGLYKPSSGRILLNGTPIAVDSYGAFRNLTSSVFSDFHLFSENYECYSFNNNPKFSTLLELMQLKGIVNSQGEPHTKKYSRGQQKRLALILSILEERPIIALDEWASEQDPTFRRTFYKELIQYLKAKGKTIVAITHDDAYLSFADRIVKFDSGRAEEFKAERAYIQ